MCPSVRFVRQEGHPLQPVFAFQQSSTNVLAPPLLVSLATPGALPPVQKAARFLIYQLSTPPLLTPSVLPLHPTTTRTDRLILVAQTAPTDTVCPYSIFTFALLASEYVTPTHTHIHISKVDTSGHATPSLARATILAYLSHAAQNAAQPVTVHVFARAQAVYLFPGSQRNPTKRALSDLELLKWWARVLGAAAADTAAGAKATATAHLYVPAETPRTLRDVWAVCQEARGGGVQWAWGLAHDSGARARHVLPRFPDDARTKVLTAHADDATTVADVQEMLAVTGECNGRLSGFFEVQLGAGAAATRGDASADEVTMADWPAAITREAFDAVEAVLMGLEFGTAEEAARSSQTLSAHLADVGVPYLHVDAEPPADASEEAKVVAQPSQNDDAAVVLQPQNAIKVQNLVKRKPASEVQNLVKRKTSPTPAGIQNLVKRKALNAPTEVQNLVKRKAAASPTEVQNLVKRRTSSTSTDQ